MSGAGNYTHPARMRPSVKETGKKRRPDRLTWDLETERGISRFLEVITRRMLKGNLSPEAHDRCVSAARLALAALQGKKIKKLPPAPLAQGALASLTAPTDGGPGGSTSRDEPPG